MADEAYSTAAPACAAPVCKPDPPDPVTILLELRERQLAAWRSVPDERRNAAAALSWGATGAMLAQIRPATPEGALAALGHALERLRADHPPGSPEDYPIPLAEHALAVLTARFSS